MIRSIPGVSLSVRVVAALALVFGGYIVLHTHFAAFDTAVARVALDLLGLETSSSGPTILTARAGTDFNVYAIVTGACSSAAGVLGIGAVSLILLPGQPWRRVVGGLVAATVYVVVNILRICSIVLVGWWLAAASRPVALGTLLGLLVASALVVVLPHGRPLARMAGLLLCGIVAVLIYDVARGYDYSAGMVTFHALAGPALAMGTLAGAILLVWRAVAGSSHRGPAYRGARRLFVRAARSQPS
jgi:hypothetical protein